MPKTIDLSRALADPSAVFSSPQDVVAASELTHEQKLAILRQWELDARELQVATEENMPGGEPARLDEVLAALAQL